MAGDRVEPCLGSGDVSLAVASLMSPDDYWLYKLPVYT
jgi:hypothetical protein